MRKNWPVKKGWMVTLSLILGRLFIRPKAALLSIIIYQLSISPAGAQISISPIGAQNWRDSLAVLNQQIAQTAWSTDLHLRKAAVNLELEQWEFAADEYSAILRREPRNPAALFYRAYAYMQQRHYAPAAADYETLLEVNPTLLSSGIGLSYAQQRMGKLRDALDVLNRMVELHPDTAVAYVARASLEQQMGQLDAALYDWEQAARLEPSNRDYMVSRVEVLIALGRKDEARELLDKAVAAGATRGQLQQWYVKCR